MPRTRASNCSRIWLTPKGSFSRGGALGVGCFACGMRGAPAAAPAWAGTIMRLVPSRVAIQGGYPGHPHRSVALRDGRHTCFALGDKLVAVPPVPQLVPVGHRTLEFGFLNGYAFLHAQDAAAKHVPATHAALIGCLPSCAQCTVMHMAGGAGGTALIRARWAAPCPAPFAQPSFASRRRSSRPPWGRGSCPCGTKQRPTHRWDA